MSRVGTGQQEKSRVGTRVRHAAAGEAGAADEPQARRQRRAPARVCRRRPPLAYSRAMPGDQTTRMLAGLGIGATLGVLAHGLLGHTAALGTIVHYVTEPAGAIFLRLLMMLVLPLVVSALALGIAGLGDVRRLGRIGLRTLAYTVVTSSIAVMLGIAAVNIFRPGEGLPPELRARLLERAGSL